MIILDLDNNSHSVFLLHYHLILVIKYRRQIFDKEISERAYICDCGNVLDRDINAAINIKNEGMRILGIA